MLQKHHSVFIHPLLPLQ